MTKEVAKQVNEQQHPLTSRSRLKQPTSLVRKDRAQSSGNPGAR